MTKALLFQGIELKNKFESLYKLDPPGWKKMTSATTHSHSESPCSTSSSSSSSGSVQKHTMTNGRKERQNSLNRKNKLIHQEQGWVQIDDDIGMRKRSTSYNTISTTTMTSVENDELSTDHLTTSTPKNNHSRSLRSQSVGSKVPSTGSINYYNYYSSMSGGSDSGSSQDIANVPSVVQDWKMMNSQNDNDDVDVDNSDDNQSDSAEIIDISSDSQEEHEYNSSPVSPGFFEFYKDRKNLELALHDSLDDDEEESAEDDSSQDNNSMSVFEVDSFSQIVEDIYKHMCQREYDYQPDPTYLDRHPQLSNSMRVLMLDNLLEIAVGFSMHRDVIFLAMNYLDRFLSYTQRCSKEKYYLLGVTCLFMAAKLEEVYPPKMKEFINNLENFCYTSKDILKMELEISDVLKWNFTYTSPNYWVSFYLFNAAKLYPQFYQDESLPELLQDYFCNRSKSQIYSVLMNLIDISLYSLDTYSFTPSVIAASALSLFHNRTDDDVIYHCTGYSREELHECCLWLQQYIDVPLDIRYSKKATAAATPFEEHCYQVYNGCAAEFFLVG